MENNNHQDTTFNGTEARQDKSVDAYFMSLPPGYGFYPSDEELIENYLKKKVMKRELPINRIFDVNLYNEHPESLTGKYKLVSANEWYFFTQRARKYPKANRPNRKAGEGYWKSIGSDVAIPQRNPQGYRASLHYYTGKHPNGRKTEWKMHEFRLRDSPSTCSNSGGSSRDSKMLDGWVLCRVYKTSEKGRTGALNGHAAANSSHLGGTTADRRSECGDGSFLQNENRVTVNGYVVKANSSHSGDTIADPPLEFGNGFPLQNEACSSSGPQRYYFHGSSSATPHTTSSNVSNNYTHDGSVIYKPLNNGWGRTGGQVGCAGMKMGNHVALDGLPSSSNPLMHFPAPEEDSWLPGLVDNSPFPENELPDELVDHYIKYDVWDDNEDEQKLKAGD